MAEASPLLAIDCATGPSSVAVWATGRLLALQCEPLASAQSRRLLPMVEAALAEAGLGYGELSGIVCTVGPGSFTGLRVGLAAARALALAAERPAMGFTTLEAVAYQAQQAGKTGLWQVALNAGKGECYCQNFLLGKAFAAQGEMHLTAQAEVLSARARGENLLSNLDDGAAQPRADALAALAASGVLAPRPLTPCYLRPADAKPMAK